MVLKFQPVPAGQVPGACSGKECEEAEKAEITVLYEADAAHEATCDGYLPPPPSFFIRQGCVFWRIFFYYL